MYLEFKVIFVIVIMITYDTVFIKNLPLINLISILEHKDGLNYDLSTKNPCLKIIDFVILL